MCQEPTFYFKNTQPNNLSKKVSLEKIRIALFDNNPARIQSIQHIILNESDLELVGVLPTTQPMIEECSRLSPDLVLVGVTSIDQKEMVTIKQTITHFTRNIKIVVMCSAPTPYQIHYTLLIGGRAFLGGNHFSNFALKLRMVYQNNIVLDSYCQPLYTRFLSYFRVLTEAQLKVLSGIVSQKSRKEIEQMLDMKPETLRQHIYRISLVLKVKGGEKAILEHFNE